MKERHSRLPSKLSVIDWFCIYISTIVLMNILASTKLYPADWIAGILPGGVNEVNLMFVYEILQASLIVGGVILFLFLRGKTLKDIGMRQPQNKYHYILAVACGVATCTLMLMVSAFLVELFPQWATTQNVVETTLQIDNTSGMFITFLSVGVLAPICEEVLFRGYLYHAVREKYGIWISIVVTSLVFALIHGQWFQLLPLFMAGFFMNCFYVYAKSLPAVILMHSAWNTFSLFLIVYANITV